MASVSGPSMLTLDDLISVARKSTVITPTNKTIIEGGALIKDILLEKRLKKISNLSSSFKPIEKPLPKCTSEKIQRIAAYKQVSKDISKWIPTITANRKADALPLSTRSNGDVTKTITSTEIISRFEPITEIEKKMASIIDMDLSVLTTGSSTETVTGSLSGSLDAIKARQIELQKLRSFLFFQQQKNKRSSKIKSKAYHRILKKEKETKKAKQQLLEGNTNSKSSILKAEIARAKVS